MIDWKYDHYISQLQRTTRKVHENFIVSSLMHDARLSDLLPLTQHYLRRDDQRYALIDLYYPQLHLAIEIDEPHHKDYLEHDMQRQKDVEERNKCDFRRINVESDDILEQIEDLKLHLLAKRAEGENNQTFSAWKQPHSTTFEDLQVELTETLFVKIRGKVADDKLLKRQTGAWSMDKVKKSKVKQVVVIHDRVVTRVFRDLTWQKDPSRGNKWAFEGKEINDLNFIGSVLLGWKYQSTRVYSNDIEGREAVGL